MENNKLIIAFTQGDTNGVGYETIFKTFSEPDMYDLCTPIVYGSLKAANYQNKVLGTECQFNTITDAKDAVEGKINIISCIDENVRVDFGVNTEESSKAAMRSLDCALKDGLKNQYDVLVCAPANREGGQSGTDCFSKDIEYIAAKLGMENKIQEIFINEETKLIFIYDGAAYNDSGNLNIEFVSTKIKELNNSLKRDFRITNPRIAVLADNPDYSEDKMVAYSELLQTLVDDGIQAFGPYDNKKFIDNKNYFAFDGVLVLCEGESKVAPCILEKKNNIMLLTGMPLVCTIPFTDAQMSIAGKGIADESILRRAIYQAIDTLRYRKEYDIPMANPLQKLYRERPDSGEKLRFAITKKKEE